MEVDWEGRLGVFVRSLRTMRVVCWVNVPDSSGAGSPGLSMKRLCVVYAIYTADSVTLEMYASLLHECDGLTLVVVQ